MFVVGLAAAMSSVTFTVAATESRRDHLEAVRLDLRDDGRRFGTEKPM